MSATSSTAENPPHVAIVGGGLIGVLLALGLSHRHIPFTIYERASGWHEIGAGIALSSVSRSSVQLLHPGILDALHRVAKANYFSFWDGFRPSTHESAQTSDYLYFVLDTPGTDYWCCMRSQLLNELVALLPGGSTCFNKELENYVDDPTRPKVLLQFKDGTTAEGDVLLGCDGIHSQNRQLLLGADSPAAHASFTHQLGYRSVLPIREAMEILGDTKAGTDFCIHIGPNAYVPSYPVNKKSKKAQPCTCDVTDQGKIFHGTETVLNLATVIYTPSPWLHGEKMVAPADYEEVATMFKDWSLPIRELISKFPEKTMKWGIFDLDNAPTFASGRVAIVGDAAHASTPFLGSGGVMGIEDALAMASAMQLVSEAPKNSESIPAALQAFSAVRMERTQWQVKSARQMGTIFQWRDHSVGNDGRRFQEEAIQRMNNVWDFDGNTMVGQVRQEFEERTAMSP